MSEPMLPPTPPANPPQGTASQNRTVMIVLSYVWLLALIPLLVEKDDNEVQWHAKHGLVLTVTEIAFWIVLSIVMSIVNHVLPLGGCVIWLLHPLFWLIFVVLHVMCIVKGVNGERFKIPGLSQFADRF